MSSAMKDDNLKCLFLIATRAVLISQTEFFNSQLSLLSPMTLRNQITKLCVRLMQGKWEKTIYVGTEIIPIYKFFYRTTPARNEGVINSNQTSSQGKNYSRFVSFSIIQINPEFARLTHGRLQTGFINFPFCLQVYQ